ncbi:MAG: glutamate racemase [Leptolyngbya sp. SIO4C1]|nr:glutamate racemase [Leptolyngbya sp. SIO4C1]
MANALRQTSSIHSSGKIGVFDSGVGGLTVLREIVRQLPHESVLYFGDTARLPYGERTPAEILRYVREIIVWMLKREVKMVVMACNTSSALALETVRSEFDVPILGVILPGARAAAKLGRAIGVISTPATAASGAYRQAILEANPSVAVWQVGCPEFVPLIEQNRIHDPYLKTVAQTYLQPLLQARIDTLIYGCTHYPHLAPVLRQILPSQVRLIDPAVPLVQAMTHELDVLGLSSPHAATTTEFYVSGQPSQFARVSARWLGYRPSVSQIDLLALAADPPLSVRSRS